MYRFIRTFQDIRIPTGTAMFYIAITAFMIYCMVEMIKVCW